MLIHSDREDDFDLPPAELWDVLEGVGAYRSWWPWLRSFDAGLLQEGAVWTAVVQPPLPYRVRFHVHIGEVVPRSRIQAQVSGDILGVAHLEISARGPGSRMRLVSDLEPANALLRALGALAGPAVRFGHGWVLDTGVRQFRDRAVSARH